MQRRKSQICEVIALHPLEQLDAALLELIRSTLAVTAAPSIEILFEKTVGKRAHGELRRFAMLKQDPCPRAREQSRCELLRR